MPKASEHGMLKQLEKRTYWCISRQRAWGVPIPVFYHKDSGEPLITRCVPAVTLWTSTLAAATAAAAVMLFLVLLLSCCSWCCCCYTVLCVAIVFVAVDKLFLLLLLPCCCCYAVVVVVLVLVAVLDAADQFVLAMIFENFFRTQKWCLCANVFMHRLK